MRVAREEVQWLWEGMDDETVKRVCQARVDERLRVRESDGIL